MSPGAGAGAADAVHVEMDVHAPGALPGAVEFAHQPLDAEARAQLPRAYEAGALAQVAAHDVLVLEHAALAYLDKVARVHVVEKLVHLVLPGGGAGDARVSGEIVELARIPVGVEANAADGPVDVLRAGLGDRVAPAGAVLSDHHRHRPGAQRIVHLGLDRGLGGEHVLRRLVVHHRLRNVGVAVVHHPQVLEDIEVEVLNVPGGVTRGLLAHSLRRLDPVLHRHSGVVATGGGDVGGSDDDHLGAVEVLTVSRDVTRHEGGRLRGEQGPLVPGREAGGGELFPGRIVGGGH